MSLLRTICLGLCVLALSLPARAQAQDQDQDRRPSHCIAIASAPGIEYLQKASFTDPVPEFSVRITYVAHSTFLVQTPGGISVATDFTGYLGPTDFVPTAVTMNHAHSSHWTPSPDPRIPNVLQGWGDGVTPTDHYVDLGEMLIRNVPTDIRRAGGAYVEPFGNSIFVFEVEGLCVGHLGHLHHEPTDAQYAALGRLDVVMAPVDGGMTLDIGTMIRVLKRLRSSIVIPMHWFGRSTLEVFLTGMADEFRVERTGGNNIEVSLRTLPSEPTIKVLEPGLLPLDDFD